MAAMSAQTASTTSGAAFAAWAQMLEAARAAARPDNAQAPAAIRTGDVEAAPRDGININDLAVSGAARDQMIAYVAQISGRSVDELTAAAAKGTLTLSATAVATKAWHGVVARLSAEARSAYGASSEGGSTGAPQLDAANVEDVAQGTDPLGGGSVGPYADALTAAAARYQAQGKAYTFTGKWGADRVTHDVGDYVGWVYQAVGQQAQRKVRTVLH